MKKYYYIKIIETQEYFIEFYWGEPSFSRDFTKASEVDETLVDWNKEDIEVLKERGTIEIITILKQEKYYETRKFYFVY